MKAPLEWIQALAAYQKAQLGFGAFGSGQKGEMLKLAEALKRASAPEALQALEDDGVDAVVLIACSPPGDLEASIEQARQSELWLQCIGVLGVAPEDPEPALQRLADAFGAGNLEAGGPGAVIGAEAEDREPLTYGTSRGSLRLFFGQDYWTKFAAAQRRRLEHVEQTRKEELAKKLDSDEDDNAYSGEVISTQVFEMRLIERVMRECYVEEQVCEEELVCAGHVLERTLVDREVLMAAMREQAARAKAAAAE